MCWMLSGGVRKGGQTFYGSCLTKRLEFWIALPNCVQNCIQIPINEYSSLIGAHYIMGENRFDTNNGCFVAV